jgi:hypothetical protein
MDRFLLSCVVVRARRPVVPRHVQVRHDVHADQVRQRVTAQLATLATVAWMDEADR